MTTTTLPPRQAPRIVGVIAQRFRRDEEGHRYYEIDFHVRTDDYYDTAAYLLDDWPLYAAGQPFDLTPDLPDYEGIDSWAFCTPELNIAAHPDAGDKARHKDWVVTQYWSTKQTWRCQTFPIENPLLEPVDITGDFVHENRTTKVDRFGKILKYPNFEPILGPATEYKYSYPTVNITFNSATLPLSTYVQLINKVNDEPLWGLPERCVRFTDAKWQRKIYGTCFYYYTTTYTFEFDINGFDKEVPIEGTLAYSGSGSLSNPKSFTTAKGITDENKTVPLDYLGRELIPTGTFDGNGDPEYLYPQGILKPEIHYEGNLLLLGIPSSLT
jgi:hypothetical protein